MIHALIFTRLARKNTRLLLQVKKKSCTVIIFGALLLFASAVSGQVTYYSIASGNINAKATWSTTPGGSATTNTLAAADSYFIQNGFTVTGNANFSAAAITIQNGGTLTYNGGRTMTVPLITIDAGGTMDVNSRNCTFTGGWLNNGTISGTTGRVNTADSSCMNNGSISFTSGRLTRTTGTLTNNGSISFSSTGQLTASDTGALVNTVNGTITFSAGGTFSFGGGNYTNQTIRENVNLGTASVTITGTAVNQVIDGFIAGGRVTCSKISGTATFTGDITCAGLTVNCAGATLDLGTGHSDTSSGTVVLTAGVLYGNTSTFHNTKTGTGAWQGTGAVFDPGNSTIVFDAAGNQSIAPTDTSYFYNLTFANTGKKTDAITKVTNILSMEDAATASAAPTYGPDATLQYNTATSRTSGVEWITPFAATRGVVIANTGTITPDADKAFSDGVPLTINSGAVFDASGNNMSFGGNLVNNGTWTPSTGNIIITGAATQSIGNFSVTGDISMTKTGGTATMTGNMSGGTLTMNGSGGTLNLGTGLTHTITGDWTNTAGNLSGGSSTLNIGGTSSGTGISFTANTGTVNYTGNGAEDVAAFTYYDLGFSGTGLKSLTGNTGVGHVLTINTGSELNLGALTLDLSGGGTPLVNNGVLTTATSTVLYSSASSALIAAEDYYDLDGSGGDRTLSSSGTIGIGNSFTPGAGTYIVTGSTVDFNGTGSQNIPAFIFNKLVVSNAGTKFVAASITVSCQTIDINDAASIDINADGGAVLQVLQ